MDPDRWHRINEIFHAALEQTPESREEFLDRACEDDSELRAEVASLLASHEGAEAFIETPAFELAAELLESVAGAAGNDADSLIGEQLGPYEVTERIGQGGMGVVYRAEDTRLGRSVAIKALAPHLTSDPRSRERLRREARAAAALSHPGIATVHALEEVADLLYIVYEYVQGPTLRDELAEGPLRLDRLARTAVEIARALAAAHERGIVHRDLKPENVIRTSEGRIKILDFGLASFQALPLAAGTPAEGARALADSPTAHPRLTVPGLLLGTPAYMSPEQLRGGDVDARADIFAFGVLIYELAAGKHPFGGENAASTIARILEVEPVELTASDVVGAPELAKITHKCLQKTPEDRYQSTADLVEELESLNDLVRTSGEKAAVDVSDSAAAAPAPTAASEAGRDERFTSGEASPSPYWWWRFHQLAVGFGYYAMLVPLYLVKEWTRGTVGESWAAAGFYSAVAVAVVAGALRIHLWFTSFFYADELDRQRQRARGWIRGAELLFVILLWAGAGLSATDHPVAATLLVGVGAVILILSAMVEPTTARAAFARGSASNADADDRPGH